MTRIRKYRVFYFALSLLLAASSAHAAQSSYFSMKTSRNSSLKPFPKWTGMVARYGSQRKVPLSQCGQKKYQPCTGLKTWSEMIEEARGKNRKQQLDIVNSWGNSHEYIVDQINWGLQDYWETPNEFMTVNGDCEDYAISKYYSLRALGVPKEDMRIIIVQDFNLGGIIHAILGVNVEGELFILDNQAKRVTRASSIYHYKPIYSINEDAWWLYTPA